MSTATVLVSAILGLLFLATAAGKLTGHAASVASRDHLAIPLCAGSRSGCSRSPGPSAW
jgi:hypothetical protein